MFAERSFTPTLNLNINVNQGGNTTDVSVTDETRYTRHEIVVSRLGCAMWSYTLLWCCLIRSIRTRPLSSPNTTQVSSVPGEVDVTWSGEGTALIQVSQLRNYATFNMMITYNHASYCNVCVYIHRVSPQLIGRHSNLHSYWSQIQSSLSHMLYCHHLYISSLECSYLPRM